MAFFYNRDFQILHMNFEKRKNKMFLYTLVDHFGNTKIGWTANPRNRLMGYRTGVAPCATFGFSHIWLVEGVAERREKETHNRFYKERLSWGRPFDSEWLSVSVKDVSRWIETRPWCVKRVTIEETPSYTKPEHPRETISGESLFKNFYRNLDLADSDEMKIKRDGFQSPVVEAIRQFISSDEKAGIVIAPCGSGKTYMTLRGIECVKRVIVVCPSRAIQPQWGGTAANGRTFDYLGVMRDTFRVVITNASSHLLIPYLHLVDLIVFDEAHHMAGTVSEDSDEGRTRRLFQAAAEQGVKRLSLTFTPRYSDGENMLSMDDPVLFGKVIYDMPLRPLISAGILPDSIIWKLTSDGSGMVAKAASIKRAFSEVLGDGTFMINHLLVYVYSLEDIDEITPLLQGDWLTVSLKGGESLTPIEEFKTSQRGILVSCRVLGEGVDIPCADSVAITYSKRAKGDIAQTIMRAGRYYPGKANYHVLLVGDSDWSSIGDVLVALSSFDTFIYDEVFRRVRKASGETLPKYAGEDFAPSRIYMDRVEKEVIPTLLGVASRLVSRREIQKWCSRMGITTSIEYGRTKLSTFPDIPFSSGTWFDFLNPGVKKIGLGEFKALMSKHNIRSISDYRRLACDLPRIIHINDGYFGHIDNFNELISHVGCQRRR